MHIKKRNGYIISGVMLLVLTLITLFLIFLFMHPTVYFSKASGFSQHDGVRAGKNKLRLVVPETVDTTKSTYISVKQEWFETSRMGRITGIKAKQGKHAAIDFTDREYNSEVFTIYTKNWFGIKREHDVIVDYSNFLRIFFPESHDGVAPRKPVILPYSKLQTEYKHIYEELYKMKGFVAFDEKGQANGQPVSKEEVFVKENARGRAFIVNNNTHISLVYDFVLPGIFKNQAQKTQVYDLVEKVMGKARTLDPESQGLEIKLNTPPFYISKFLGWYYIDPVGNRVDLNPGEEFLIPQWVKSELRLIAKYDITTDGDKIGPELDKQGLVAVSYFDGAERVFFDIVKKGSPLKEHVYQKPGYTYEGWYRDSSLTEKVNFAYEVASAHTVLYLKSIKQNQPQPEKPVKYHTVNFITPSGANQLLSTRRVHGEKLETNYLTPSLVSKIDEHGNLWELDHWNLVDPITGTRTRFDFNTPITEDITLEAVMRKSILPTSKYTIKRYFESVDQAGNFIEDKSKEEVVENQTPGQEVQLSPTQTNAPTGFKLADGTITNKKINKDGTTVFELKYTRNRYKVNFEVNYNGNHFKDVNASSTPEQTIPYEGKLTKPANPTITKAGYTYTFKHWQLKDEMGNVYKEVNEFDFNNKITKNLTLVAYFEEKKDTATYTVKHIFQGIQNQIDERVEERKFTEQVGKSVTVTQENRDKGYDQHFEVADFSETKKVEADGSTVFEIRYARKKYKVNFVVNYNNHFQGATASVEAEQEIPYEGKVKKPEFSPSLAKDGYTYTFKHWQLKDQMGGTYKETTPYDFNTPITKNTTLVAYFEENGKTANYTIKHIFEGVDTIPQKIEKEVKTAQVGTQITVNQTNGFTRPGFELEQQSETKTIEASGLTEFTLRYIRKTYTVDFNYNSGQLNGQSSHRDTYKFEQILKDTPHPEKLDPTNQKTYTFIGWENEETGEIFDFSKNVPATKNLKLKAKWQEATATRLVYLKLVWESLDDTTQDTETELVASKPRAIGETARVNDQDIQEVINRFKTNSPHPNHLDNFDDGESTTQLTVTSATSKQYLKLYFKAKTYTVTFDYSGLELTSVADELKTPITLKYTQKLSQTIVAKMNAVLKPHTPEKDFELVKWTDQSGQDFDPAIAYNRDLTLKPVFKEKDVFVDITPKVADIDQDKVENPTWSKQTTKVGTKFDFQPTGVKPGWKFLGWTKTPGGQAEDIIVSRDTREVYAVFAPGETTYTIKHVFEGVDDIAQREEIVTKSTKTNSQVTVSSSDRLTQYDHGFEVKTPAQTQTVSADGSTTFTLNYTRRVFDVTFNVNFKGQLEGQASQNPDTQKVKYEGKAIMPITPSITKHGRTYDFIHWQTETSMNGVYSQQSAYDFSGKVTQNLSLVAYFTETRHKVNYKIIHKLEKKGPDSSLNGTYDEVVEEQKDQLVENGATYKPYNNLDNNLYEKDNNQTNVLNQPLTVGNNNTVVYQHYKLKEITVEYKKTAGIQSLAYEQKNVKKTRKVPLPTYTLKNTHNFLGWSLTQTGGTTQTDFIAGNTNITIYAQTDFQDRKITYTIKTQKVDGNYVEKTEIKNQKIGTVHTVSYSNPDNTVYQNPKFDKSTLTVNQDESQNKVVVTIDRKTYTVTYEVVGHSYQIPSKTFRHGQTHGEIDESKFKQDGVEINKLELDGNQKTKEEIKKLEVKNNHKIKVYVGEPVRLVSKYPQTKVDNPEGISHFKDEERELKFNSKAKDYTLKFTRSFWKDTAGNTYEKYDGQYFKFEDVEFVKIPKQNTWFTKKIIDFTPYNIYYSNYLDNAKPQNSILKSIVGMIGTYVNQDTFMPTYDDSEFSVKPALDARLHTKLIKESTDYAKAILTQYNGTVSSYRGNSISSFIESDGVAPYYNSGNHQNWWLGTQYPNSNPNARNINSNGNLNNNNVNNVFGVVVCIR